MQFLAPRRHRVVVAAVDHLDVFDPRQAFGRAAGVHGDVAAADHEHGLGQRRARAVVDLVEETHAVAHEGFGFVGDPHRLADEGADREQHRIVPLLQLVECDVTAERAVQVHFDPRAMRQHAVDVLLHRGLRQAKARDTPVHHAAELIGGLVHVHLVTGLGEIVRGGKARGAGADDGDGLVLADRDRRQRVTRPERFEHVALEVADRDRAVAVGAAAGRLAGRVADAAADRAERVGRGDRLERFLELALPDVGDVRRRVGAYRAGDLARRRDEMNVRGIVFEVRRRGDRKLVIGVGNFHCQPALRSSSSRPVNGRWIYLCSGRYGRPVMSAASGVSATRSPRPTLCTSS